MISYLYFGIVISISSGPTDSLLILEGEGSARVVAIAFYLSFSLLNLCLGFHTLLFPCVCINSHSCLLYRLLRPMIRVPVSDILLT